MRYNCQENKRRDSKRKWKGMVQNKYIKFLTTIRQLSTKRSPKTKNVLGVVEGSCMRQITVVI